MQGYIEELGRDATERSWAMSRRALPPVAFLALMLATLLAPAAPAYPQTTEEDLAADEDGNLVGPRPPDYQVDGNGFLVIGGDVRMPCSTIGEPPGPSWLRRTPEAAQAKLEQERKEQVRTCHAAGFDTAEDPPAGASPSPDASTAGNNVALPETGGPSLPVPLLAAAAALLAAGGLLARRVMRR